MAPTLEIISAPAKPGVNVKDRDSDAGKLAYELCLQLVDQPGCHRAYIGHEIENPGMFRFFAEWGSYDDHMRFTKQDEYGPFAQRFTSLFDGKMEMYHAHTNPWPPQVALSDTTTPAIECLLVYFQPDLSEALQKKFDGVMSNLATVLEGDAKGYTGFSGGWVMEELQSEHGPAKAYFAAIGWQSRDAHMEFRETELFKKTIPSLRGAEGLLGVKVVHSSCIEVQKGPAGGAGGG